MPNPKVVHCKRSSYDVYVGRPSIWGNPFTIGRDGTRAEVIAKYREYVLQNSLLLSQLGDLKNKTLGCWCAPKGCHGDVLAELASLTCVGCAEISTCPSRFDPYNTDGDCLMMK